MNTNLVAIDTTGLNAVLGEIRQTVSTLIRDGEHNTKRDIAHLKETENIKVSMTQKFTDLKKELSVIMSKLEDNGLRLDSMDDLVVRLTNSITASEQYTQNQMETDNGQDYKIMMIKREVQESSQKLMKECEMIAKRITDSNSILDDQITKGFKRIEPELLAVKELKEKADSSENTITDILDRVEQLENTALTQPQQPVYREDSVESLVDVRGSVQKGGAPQTQQNAVINQYQQEAVEDSLQFKILQQIKDTLKQEGEISKLTLRQLVSDKMSIIVQNELQIKASKLILTEGSLEGEVVVEGSVTVELPKTDFNHLPSLIEQAMEAHIKEVGDKVIYLEQIGSSKRRDGVYEVGTDTGQIQAHMEVQTFQYDRLNKNQSETNLTIAQMTFQIEELTKKIKSIEKRVAATEEVQTYEITEDGAAINTESVLQAIKSLKSEMTLKMVSKDTIRELTKNIEILQEQVQPFDLMVAETKFKDVLQDIRGQIEAFPRELQTIQLQLLRTENTTFEANREISDIWHRIVSYEKAAKMTHESISQLFNESDAGKRIDTKHIVQLVSSLRDYTNTNFAQQQSVQKQATSITELLTTMEQIKGHQQISHAKVLEHSKQIRMFGGQSTKIVDEMTDNKQWIGKIKKTLNEKVDQDVYDNEKEEVYSAIAALDNVKPTLGGHGSLASAPKQKPRKSAPPSTAMNAQTKAAIETISTLEDQMTHMKSQLKNLNLGILRESIDQTAKQLDMKANKTVLDKSLVQLNTESSKIQQAMEKIRLESETVMLNNSKQMQRLMESQEARSVEFKKMQDTLDRVEETIIALKRKNAGANARAGLMEKAALKNDNNQVSFSVGGEQAEELMGNVKQEFNQFKTDIQRKVENYDYKLAMLMPLVGGDKKSSKDEKKLNAMEEMELKLTEKLARQDQAQVRIMSQLQQEFDALNSAFKEKIRRQGLVQQQMKNHSNDDSGDDVRKNLKKRKKTYLAEQMTRELVLNGRLPQFGMQGDHIARYGKGFSQMLNIANPSNQFLETLTHRNHDISGSLEQVDGQILNQPSHPELLRVSKQGSFTAHNTFGTMDGALKSAMKSPLSPNNERVTGEKTYILRSKKKNSVFVDVSQEKSQDGQDSTAGIWHGEKLPSIVRTNEDFTQIRIHNQTK